MPEKAVITLGKFRVAEFRELPESDLTAIRFESATKKRAPLEAIKFFKSGEEFSCFFLVTDEVADRLKLKKTYIITVTEEES
jgi:hypothetical protein